MEEENVDLGLRLPVFQAVRGEIGQIFPLGQGGPIGGIGVVGRRRRQGRIIGFRRPDRRTGSQKRQSSKERQGMREMRHFYEFEWVHE